MSWFTDARFSVLFLVILFRYLIIAFIAFLIFYIIKKQAWTYRKIQSRFPIARDYTREIFYSIITSLIFALIGYGLFRTPIRPYTQLYTQLEEYGVMYFFVSVGIMILAHDTYFYWTHRLMHHPTVFPIFHKIHHLSTNPSPWAAFAFHPLEAIIEAGIIVVIAFIMPVHPLALALFLLIMMMYNVYGHLGYELYPKGFAKTRLGRWLNTSVNHNQHHQFFKGNYGLYFLWWDRWMGTIRPDYDHTFEEVKSRLPD
ncbi:MAG TPA: sterol desaturase family protein [Cyclobacteriaceae bacterium]|nr:sterol desaturase family protein [Cyclobacteriaceae bacterium]